MRLPTGTAKSWLSVILLGGLSGALGACTGGADGDEAPVVTDGEAAAPEGGDKTAPSADTADAELEKPAALAAPAAPPPEPAPAKAAALSKPAPTPAPAPAGPRVVRYVKSDDTPVHGQASDTAETVSRLAKGDRVMVVEENGWGRIGDAQFVKLEHLSAQGIGRSRPDAVWQAPTN